MANLGTLAVDRIETNKQTEIEFGNKISAPHFLKKEIDAIVANEATNIATVTWNGIESVSFPGTGAPSGEFAFVASR